MTSTKSTWLDEVKLDFKFPKLSQDIHADVVIVGAGITGITTAYLLAKAGKKVIVLDKNKVLSGETSYTTAFITHVIDADLSSLVKALGIKKAKQVWESGVHAIDLIESIIKSEKIACEFERVPARVYINNPKELKYLETEKRLAHKIGFEAKLHQWKEQSANELSDDLDIQDETNLGFDHCGYLEIPNQAKFEPLLFLRSLIEICTKLGVEFYEDTMVEKYCCQNPTKVTTEDGFTVSAQYCVVATHYPNNGMFEMNVKSKPMQTYVIEFRTNKFRVPAGIYWDSEDPYHYFRVDRKGSNHRIILGGGDHETGKKIDTDEKFENLEKYFQKIFPRTNYEIVNRWSGQVIVMEDLIPMIGQNPANEYQLIATGFAGDGILFGPLSAKINSDIILGKENPYIDLYKPRKVSGIAGLMRRGMNFMSETVKSKLKIGLENETEIDKLEPDSGKVFNLNGKAVAVYKSKDGEISKHSANCTHMGCVVTWNDSQKTWDCPCHGSRFKKTGEVISGPAKKPLN